MTDETPPEQDKQPTPEEPITHATAARMALDIVCQTMTAAPARTWIQSANHPGSRRWLVTCLAGISQLLGKPLPAPTGSTRRHAAITALESLTARTRSAGTWAQAAPEARDQLAELLATTSAPFPVTMHRIARSGALPFSEREMARVQRRTNTIT